MYLPFDTFVHAVIVDPKYRALLRKDPEKALRHLDIEPTDQLVEALKRIDWASMQKIVDSYRLGARLSC